MEVGGVLGVSSSMFWLKCNAPFVYASHESVGETQVINHLGFNLNIKEGKLHNLPQKLKM
jgi:hypothetical protein